MESINYNQLYNNYTPRSHASFKNTSAGETVSDAVEISEQARLHLLEKNALKKHQSGLQMSPDNVSEIRKLIDNHVANDGIRNARIHELRGEIIRGAYDFDSVDKFSKIANILS